MPADAQPKVETQESADAKMIDLPDRKSTRLNSSHGYISYAVFCLKKQKQKHIKKKKKKQLFGSENFATQLYKVIITHVRLQCTRQPRH